MTRERGEWIPWYCDDSPGWLELSLAARGAAEGIARKMGKSRGELHLGSRGLRGLAVLLRCSWEELEPALRELTAGDHPRFIVTEDERVLIDPEHETRRLKGSTVRMHNKRGRDGRDSPSPSVTGRHEASPAVTPSPLLSSDLHDLGSREGVQGETVARDAPLRDDARSVFDAIAMNRPIGEAVEVVWLAFCGHFAGQTMPSREAILGRWQKWVTQQASFAAKDRDRERTREDQRKRRFEPPEPPKISREQARREAQEFAAKLAARRKDPAA